MRTVAAVFVLALSIVGICVISRGHGFSLSHLLPSPGEKGVGVIQRAAPFVIILLTLWALSRLTRRGGSSSASDSRPSSQATVTSDDDAGYEPDGGDEDGSADNEE